MELYATEDWHCENNDAFLRAVAPFGLKLFKPNPERAPWHVQAVIDLGAESVLLNFWPHKLKAQRDGCHSVVGIDAILKMIAEAVSDAERLQDFSLIED